MSLSSGTISGTSGQPSAKLIVNNTNYYLTIYLNRELDLTNAGTANISLGYGVHIPKRVECGIDIVNNMGTSVTNLKLLGQTDTGDWVEVSPNSEQIVKQTSETPISCFDRLLIGHTFNVDSNNKYCNLIICLDGTFSIPKCKQIDGCEPFCLKVNQILI